MHAPSRVSHRLADVRGHDTKALGLNLGERALDMEHFQGVQFPSGSTLFTKCP
jgi:hypothetical protein